MTKVYCDFLDNPRTDLNKMLTDIKNKKIKSVVVYSIDKLSSKAPYLYKNWNFFKQYGVTLVPILSIHDLGHKGNLSADQFVYFSNFESDVLHLRRPNENQFVL